MRWYEVRCHLTGVKHQEEEEFHSLALLIIETKRALNFVKDPWMPKTLKYPCVWNYLHLFTFAILDFLVLFATPPCYATIFLAHIKMFIFIEAKTRFSLIGDTLDSRFCCMFQADFSIESRGVKQESHYTTGIHMSSLTQLSILVFHKHQKNLV